MSLRRVVGGAGLEFSVEIASASVAGASGDGDACQQLAAIDDYCNQVFTYGRAWDCILSACRTDTAVGPVSLLAHVLAIDFWIAKDDIPAAITSLSTAQSIFARQPAESWSQRDVLFLRGFEAMMSNKLADAIEIFQRLLDRYPADLFVVKKVQLLAFVLGDRRGMLDVAQRADVVAACHQRPFYHGMLAFALEENDCLVEAREAALKGLELNPRDPWCVHVMAHVFYAEAQLDEGLEWLTARTSVWTECMSFLYAHNYFHLALLKLDRDEYVAVGSILDQRVWPFDSAVASAASSSEAATAAPATSFGVPVTALSFKLHDADYAEDQNAALNLLWRFEIRYTCAPTDAAQLPQDFFTSRWQSLVARVKSPPSQLPSLFGLLQVWALFRSGQTEQAETALATMRTQVSQMAESDQKAKLEITLLPIAAAIAATHAKDGADSSAQRAFDLLQPVFDPVSASVAVSSTSTSSSPSASPPTPLAQAPHLSCLCASGEQLEVLTEWWLQLCLEAGQHAALSRTIQAKTPQRREAVAWYARLEQSHHV